MAKRNFINNASINRIHIIIDRIISKLGKETNFRNLTGQNALQNKKLYTIYLIRKKISYIMLSKKLSTYKIQKPVH